MTTVENFKYIKELINFTDLDAWGSVVNYFVGLPPLVVFYGMVLSAIKILGSEEQNDRWV